MAIIRRGGDKSAAAADDGSFHTLFGVILAANVLFALSVACLLIWLRRRRHCRGRKDEEADDEDEEGGGPEYAADANADAGEAVVYDAVGGGSGSGNDTDGSGLCCLSAASEEDARARERARVRAERERRKLTKACSMGAGWNWSGGGGGVKRHTHRSKRSWSMALIPRVCTRGHFHFGFSRSESCRWPEEEEEEEGGKVSAGAGEVEMRDVNDDSGLAKVCKRKSSWIDEDALHGPKVSSGGDRGFTREAKRKSRGSSWPLRNRAPTLPRVHHTVHGYPYSVGEQGEGSSEALLDYAQLRDFSRVLPVPPKPALVAHQDRRAIRPSVTMGYVYGVPGMPKPVISPPVSPTRSLPVTPSRLRGRQQSTDSTLTEILRSTEKRLREGSVTGTVWGNKLAASPTKTSPSKTAAFRGDGVPAGRSRPASPVKHVPNQPGTPGHKRQDSQQSVSSEADSLVGQECASPDTPTGLTSPSRRPKKQEQPEGLPARAHSVRTSLSSELSTLYSEDEMPEEVRKAIQPLEGLVVQPQQPASVGAPSMNDPFATPFLPLSVSRASSVGRTGQTRHNKSQDLFRASLQQQRSQRLRSMTVGQAPAQPGGLILAPGPVMSGAIPTHQLQLAIPSSRRGSVTIPPSIQPYIAPRASESLPSPNRQSPTAQTPSGPLFLRVTKTSTLSTIPSLPPPSAPGLGTIGEQRDDNKPSSPVKMSHPAVDPLQEGMRNRVAPALVLPSTERSSAPPSPTRRVGGEVRLSFVLAPKQREEKRSSTASSVYSQDARPATAAASAAVELNRANFRANSSLYPAPLSPRSRVLGPSSAARNSSDPQSPNHGDAKEDNRGDHDEDEEEEAEEEEDRKLAIPTTIASLRRMNSGISTASSLASITDRNPSRSPSPPPSPSPKRMTLLHQAVPAASSPAKVGGGGTSASASAASTPARHSQSHRKSIGARNYFAMGESSSSPRLSRNGIVRSSRAGGGSASASPTRKRRRPTSAARDEGKENTNRGGFFKLAGGEFTFEVSSPTATTAATTAIVSSAQDGLGKGALGLREGSAANVNNVAVVQQQQGQRLSLAWKPAVGEGPGSNPGSPSRGSLKSVDSLGLYDRQGFLISASPARGLSPVGLRV
ncbi:uncharacterized protein B0T15DRAFT_392346 [Chaetomium strumarium]|uniref:Uncharacterized protein n=1 Tax=Chaetomium strumarium TaxID=1170767 RepID=A0AAJ0GZ14_9PEZI|nr:hypothetical protein B0T15DRAFT_392346 [Chaetomium strumarium]